jgi:hypothetical protein
MTEGDRLVSRGCGGGTCCCSSTAGNREGPALGGWLDPPTTARALHVAIGVAAEGSSMERWLAARGVEIEP